MAVLSDSDQSEVVDFLTEVEAFIIRISTEAERRSVNRLLEAETLLQDVTFVSELFPSGDGESLVRAIASIYLLLENSSREHLSRWDPGRPQIEISEAQLTLLLSFQLTLLKCIRYLSSGIRDMN